MLGLLTGVWVALSPWFLTLQNTGTNANTVNLISGLAVAGLGAFALISPRGFAGLQVGTLLLGAWLIIAGPVLSQKFSIADSMFWSNSCGRRRAHRPGGRRPGRRRHAPSRPPLNAPGASPADTRTRTPRTPSSRAQLRSIR